MPIKPVRIRYLPKGCHVTNLTRLAVFGLPLAFASLSLADDKVPAPTVNPTYTPPLPAANPSFSEAQLEAIIDRAVSRAVDQRLANWQPATTPAAVPQTAVVPTSGTTVHVLVQPGPISSALAKFGERLTALGEPRLRKMKLHSPYTTTTPAPAAAAAMLVPVASPQGFAPQASMQR